MAYVTLDDLRQKGVTGASYDMQNNAWQVSGGSQADRAYYAELVKQAQGLMESLGIKPDAVSSFSTDSGDFSKPYYSSALIERTLKERGLQMGVDPSRSSGKLGGSGSWTLQMGLLDPTGNPVQEFQTGEQSIGSSFFKGFVAPFASIVLTGNASSIGAAIAPTAPAAVQTAIGGAVASGAGTALSGGDPEDVIKNALIGGAVGAIGEMVKPYIQDAIDFVKDLTPEGLQDVVAAAGDAGDVAGAVADVDVGGAGDVGAVDLGADPLYGGAYSNYNTAELYNNYLSDYGKDVYAGELALGKSSDAALRAAFRADGLTFPTEGNALATGGAAGATTPANALADGASAMPMAGATGLYNPQTGAPTAMGARYEDLVNSGLPSDVAYSQVLQEFSGTSTVTGAATSGAGTSPSGVAAVDLTGGQTAGAGTVADAGAGLGAAGTAAGVAGAGAAAGSAGAGAGTAAGTTVGAGGDMIDLGTDPLYGGAYTGSGAAESALTGATAGAAAGAAAGLTGIPVVDDFLKYLGTPAGAAALGAFGSLASGYITGQAAKDAAQIQADAAANALKLQREQFEYQKELLDPYRRRGESALNRLAGVMGLDGQPAQPQQLLEMDPGYAFRLGEGMKALERVQAARGNMLSGGAIKAGQRYAQDFASGEYGNAYNRLANIAGLGQTVGGQLGTAAQQFGQTAGETMSQGANALAAGRIGRTSGYMGGIGGAVGAYQNYQNQQQQNQLFGRYIDIYGRAVGAGG